MKINQQNIQHYQFSDYIVYVDESGNADIKNIDEKYPVFVLTFCIVKKTTYTRYIVPQFQNMKFQIFGHDGIVFHSYDIRQKENDFASLQSEDIREEFFQCLNEVMEESSYVIISSVIKKQDYVGGLHRKRDIYHHALQFCLERLHDFLIKNNQHQKLTHIICECRGKKEDRMLEEEFEQILTNTYDYTQKHRRSYVHTPMKIKFIPKTANATGLQIADLLGQPIGRHIISPHQKNRAFEIMENKFFRKGGKRIGLKVFPQK